MDELNSLVEAHPIAKICGQPLHEVPHDLYIPPEALEIFLDTFEGPLDLLLYLIRKHNLDILDIPMAELTQQYMAYVEAMRADQLELAAEYLLMTALLIEIKSRMLLPKPIHTPEEEADPRVELVRRLLEYEQMKKAALRLDELPQLERDFMQVQVLINQRVIQQLVQVNLDDLQQAWLTLLQRAKLNTRHHVQFEAISVRSCMSEILRKLKQAGTVSFYDLFSPSAAIGEVIANFLAILELAKELLIEVEQAESFGTIYVRSI
ncbi:MAG: segregation/condensation protein A [Nitrosomonas sp.]|nr:MAG: segregation/condensation protein A [Nitrosomonas sp.]